jgi:hypothetical protein
MRNAGVLKNSPRTMLGAGIKIRVTRLGNIPTLVVLGQGGHGRFSPWFLLAIKVFTRWTTCEPVCGFEHCVAPDVGIPLTGQAYFTNREICFMLGG